MSLEEKKVLILGYGYVAQFYLKKNPSSLWTSRKVTENTEHSFYFDLLNKESWKNIPNVHFVLWTFSAARNHEEVIEAVHFFDLYLKNKNVIILSTTSAYKTTNENEEVDENSNLNFENPRVFAEEELRKKGALILHLSGIIGPERYPKIWYQKNLVKYGENILNYVHVEDIIHFVDRLFKSFKQFERFNLTSCDYKTHKQIAEKLNGNYVFEYPNQSHQSKKIKNFKLLNYLNETSYPFKNYPEHCEI